MRRLALALPILLVFALVASSRQAKAAAPKKIDPCSIFTKADIQEAIGVPVKDGVLNTKANAAVGYPCEYGVEPYGAFSVLIVARGLNTPEKFKAEAQKANLKPTEAPGLGDGSFFTDPGYGMLQLNTFKADTYLIITLMSPKGTPEKNKAAAEKLMRKALLKL
jgi:hypothetical protein